MLTICFVVELSGLTYILMNGTLWSNVTWWLKEKFLTLIYTSDFDPKGARILRIAQENVRSFRIQNQLLSWKLSPVVFRALS